MQTPQQSLGPPDDGCIDHFPVDDEDPHVALTRRDHLPCPIDFRWRRPQAVVHHGDLAGMDAQQAAEALVTRTGGGCRQTGQVIDGWKDAVQRCGQPGQSALQQE